MRHHTCNTYIIPNRVNGPRGPGLRKVKSPLKIDSIFPLSVGKQVPRVVFWVDLFDLLKDKSLAFENCALATQTWFNAKGHSGEETVADWRGSVWSKGSHATQKSPVRADGLMFQRKIKVPVIMGFLVLNSSLFLYTWTK